MNPDAWFIVRAPAHETASRSGRPYFPYPLLAGWLLHINTLTHVYNVGATKTASYRAKNSRLHCDRTVRRAHAFILRTDTCRHLAAWVGVAGLYKTMSIKIKNHLFTRIVKLKITLVIDNLLHYIII